MERRASCGLAGGGLPLVPPVDGYVEPAFDLDGETKARRSPPVNELAGVGRANSAPLNKRGPKLFWRI